MIHISRNPGDRRTYLIMLTFSEGDIVYIDFNPASDHTLVLTRQNIGDAAKRHGKDWDKWADKFTKQYKKIMKLSKRISAKIDSLDEIPEEMDQYYINSGGFFTLHEINYFDYCVRKYKLNRLK